MEQNQQNGQDIADSQAASAEARVRLMNELKSSIDAAEGWLQQGDESDGAGAASSTSGSAYIHDNPWKSVGIGAAVGLAVGLLISRK
ncbi:MAG: DUF883 family protein [Rhodospirillaceae bacterium]|nr:DUF883 family protein [Rhodospirillaceae bacterium]